MGGELHRLKTWELRNGRGKEVNDVLKDFDELERTGLGPGNAIVARRYPVKYGGGEAGGGRGGLGGGGAGKGGGGNKRAKDGGDIEMEGGRSARGKEREASFDGPRVPGLPRDLTLTESQK